MAADFEMPAAPAPQYYEEQEYQEYYDEPPVEPGYVMRPPAPIYPYAAPIYRYGYGPPVAVVPLPYYRPYRSTAIATVHTADAAMERMARRYRAYAGRGYGVHAGRSYGAHGGPYRGHR